MTLCQKCQGAVATVIITNIPAGGKPIGIHLCKKCAMAEGVITGPEQAGPPAGLPLQALAGMLPSTLPQGGAPAMLHLQALVGLLPSGLPVERKCPHCGITLSEIRKKGVFGCQHDYQVFAEALVAMLPLIQAGGQRHVGKIPVGADAETRRTVLRARADALRRRLDTAVMREEYETAAELRDEIDEIEKKISP